MNEKNTATNELLHQCTKQAKHWAGPAVSVISYGLIIGFALSGIGIMMLSALVWLLFGVGSFSGFGLLTGGLFLSAATALFLGKLMKTGDALYQNRKKQPTAA